MVGIFRGHLTNFSLIIIAYHFLTFNISKLKIKAISKNVIATIVPLWEKFFVALDAKNDEAISISRIIRGCLKIVSVLSDFRFLKLVLDLFGECGSQISNSFLLAEL